jgi:hypothetical protein
MKNTILKMLIGCLAVVTSAAQEPTPNPAAFFVRISWSDIELSPHGIIKNDCLLVLPDGHFHMEERLQQLPDPRSSLHIHESLLGDTQLEQLRSIFKLQQIVMLPEFFPFPFPVAVTRHRDFQAEISRNQETVQNVGFREWEDPKPDEGVEPSLEALEQSRVLAQSQRPAKTALHPLFQWILDLESQQLPDSGESTLCKIE